MLAPAVKKLVGVIQEKKTQQITDKVAFRYINEEKKKVTLETIKVKLNDLLKKVFKNREINGFGISDEYAEETVSLGIQCKLLIFSSYFSLLIVIFYPDSNYFINLSYI